MENENVVEESKAAISDDNQASWVLRMIKSLKQQADLKKAALRLELTKIEDEMRPLEADLEDYLFLLNANDPDMKSKKYAHGSIQLRKAPDKIIAAEDAKLGDFADTCYVKTKYELDKVNIKNDIKSGFDIPLFVKIIPGEIGFSCSFNDEPIK